MVLIWILAAVMLSLQELQPAIGYPIGWDEWNAATIFQKECPLSRCSADGPVVSYPLHLKDKPNNCSNIGDLALSCSGNTTVVNLSSGAYSVTDIYYTFSSMYFSFQPWDSCFTPNNITMPNVSGTPFYYDNSISHVWLNCSAMLNLDQLNKIDIEVVPILCLSGTGYFVYMVSSFTELDGKLQHCTKFAESRNLHWYLPELESTPHLGAYLNWNTSRIPGDCSLCSPPSTYCGLGLDRNKTICYVPGLMYQHHRDSSEIHRIALSIGITVGIILIIGAPMFFLLHKKQEKAKEVRREVELFIKNYNATSPTRYTYHDIIKITKRFQTKLGQGGFGAVFKGLLPNGIPVAVKILKFSAGNGDEFINEVSTVGRIHHIHVVHLLGFCSEGARRALIYELMENGSLDRYIFYKQLGQIRHRRFNLEVLQNMVIGIAEGIEYLHQGCSQRILHLDIKPHNILLDHNFNPKISDFGLSKICPKDQSYITVSAARGTLSYMAPEVYFRNFGTVSYKSDVYSFGMLILEMVSGRRNKDPVTENQSDVYFPELIHEHLIHGEDLHMILDSQGNDVIARKLVTVALWCIQWSPTDRPTMARVVNMLMGDIENLPIPPKPSISSH